MALSIAHINSLQVEIVNLEFKKEIFKCQDTGTGVDLNEYTDELEAWEAQIAKLRGHLNQLISSLPTIDSHSQQDYSFISSLPQEGLSAIFMQGPTDAPGRTAFVTPFSGLYPYHTEYPAWQLAEPYEPAVTGRNNIVSRSSGVGRYTL